MSNFFKKKQILLPLFSVCISIEGKLVLHRQFTKVYSVHFLPNDYILNFGIVILSICMEKLNQT